VPILRLNIKESRTEQDVRDMARVYGVEAMKLSIDGQNGWPDRMFLIPGGRPLFIEFKKPGEEPEPLQKKRHRYLRKQGYHVEVCTTFNTALGHIIRAVDASKKGGAKTLKKQRVRSPQDCCGITEVNYE
jgi:hypothetical protein